MRRPTTRTHRADATSRRLFADAPGQGAPTRKAPRAATGRLRAALILFAPLLLVLALYARADAKPAQAAAKPAHAAATAAKPAATAAAAAPDAHADAGTLDAGAAAADAAPSTASADDLDAQLADLRLVLTDAPPEKHTLAELFGFDVRADDQVATHARALEAKLGAGAGAPDAGRVDAGAADAGASDAGAEEGRDAGESPTERALRLEREVAQAKLAFLREPRARRKLVADAEAERQRAARDHAALETEREKAQREAHEAESARQRALDAAEAARTAAERFFANETARAEGTRRDQARLRQKIADAREAFRKHGDETAELDARLVERARAATQGSAAASSAYDALVKALGGARDDLAAALSDAETPDVVPRFEPSEDAPVAASALADQRKALDDLAGTLKQSADDLQATIDAHEREALDHAIDRELRLNEERIALLDRLPADKREAVLGFGAEGVAQLRREITHVRLGLRWYVLARRATVRDLGQLLRSPLWVARFVGRAFWLAVLVLAAGYVARRGRPALETARGLLVRTSRGSFWARPLLALVGAVHELVPELVLFAAVELVPRALDDALEVRELGVAFAIVSCFAWYRLALAVAFHAIAWLSRDTGARIAPEYREKILRSLRVVGRYALFISIVLAIAVPVLGRGYLYHLVASTAWLGAIPIAATLVRWWREDISDAYLRFRGKGPLADAVRRTRRTWYGFFVSAAAVLILASVAAGRLVTRFVLGFEQSRKALAYLFRRRLERHAEAQDESELPHVEGPIAEALSEEPLADDALAIDHYPGMDELERAIAAFRKGDAVGSALVVGDTGYGKTSWLREAARRTEPLAPVIIELDDRVPTESALAATLARALGAPEPAALSLDALAAFLREGPRRLVAVDDAQFLYRRGVGAFEVWRAFMDLVARTGHEVFWICAMGRYPHEYLDWARSRTDVFRLVVRLRAWSEEEIARLLRTRMSAARCTVRYDDLVVDRLEGVEGEAQLLRTEAEYARLIWDYAEGCPRTALRCWRNSLVPGGDHAVRVRLFRMPRSQQLDRLTPAQRFILASLVWHGNVSAEEAAEVLRLPQRLCADTMAQLGEWGVVETLRARHHVTTEWLQPVRRHLRRAHLIED